MTQSTDAILPAPQERILEETRLKLALAREHLESLSKFGLTADWLDALTATADRIEAMPTYTDQRNDQKLLTAEKDVALAEYAEWGRTLRLRLELTFGRNSIEYDQFPATDFRNSDRNESKAILLLPVLTRIARRFADRLASAGQTAEDLSAAAEILTRLKAANETQEEYKLTSRTITSDRRQAYSELAEGVRRIERVGQAVYGADSPNGQLFRSNWTTTGNASESTEPTDSPEPAINAI